jgi:lipopolysaccharide/colanic/teichoic acid biosynthesis glycosyltransferase
MKRLIDLLVAAIGLLCFGPVLLLTMFLVWRQDHHSPFYIAPRVGKNGEIFDMVKLRSMVINADKSGVDSTSSTDKRITPIGHFIRKYKLDEVTQLWNVFKGDMSLVGPRPNVKRETDLYTSVERELLSVKPGITDIASIVFSDENEILKDSNKPDIDYNQLIRPWKSRLGLIYIEHKSNFLDIFLIFLTTVSVVSRKISLQGISWLLGNLHAPESVIRVSKREEVLVPYPPPGSKTIVMGR